MDYWTLAPIPILFQTGPESERDYIEKNFAIAVSALLRLGRAEQAAILCKRAPAHRLPFRVLLRDFEMQDGFKLAIACMAKEDWSTSLRLLDWALEHSPGNKSQSKILVATEKIARHIWRQDPETYHAKIITLQLSPLMSEHVLAVARKIS